jgi:hypothetical protein
MNLESDLPRYGGWMADGRGLPLVRRAGQGPGTGLRVTVLVRRREDGGGRWNSAVFLTRLFHGYLAENAQLFPVAPVAAKFQDLANRQSANRRRGDFRLRQGRTSEFPEAYHGDTLRKRTRRTRHQTESARLTANIREKVGLIIRQAPTQPCLAPFFLQPLDRWSDSC